MRARRGAAESARLAVLSAACLGPCLGACLTALTVVGTAFPTHAQQDASAGNAAEKSAAEKSAGGGGAPAAPPERNWLVSCSNASADGEMLCRMTQRGVVAESGRQAFAITLARRGADGEIALLIAAPHGVLLPKGVALSVDGAAQGRLAFRACDARACLATGVVSPELLAAFRAGTDLELGLTALDGRVFTLKGTLIGFSKAFDSFVF